jgi:hypothetical protein
MIIEIGKSSYVTSSVLKLTIVEMKLSRIMILRIDFQSVVSSPSNKQIDSRVNLTPCGGLLRFFISTKFCFLIDLTAREKKAMAERE